MQIEDRESKCLELKSTLPSFQSLIKTCVAFANGLGGKILIGVDEKSSEVVGIDDAIRDRVYDEFRKCLYETTSPSLLTEIYEKRYGEKSVMVIEVFSSNKKPVYVKSEGNLQGVYLRVGSSTRKGDQAMVKALMRENKCTHYDEEAVDASPSILSEALIDKVVGSHDQQRLLQEKILMRAASSQATLQPTITGVLMFCDEPDQYLPEALIYCTRYRGVEGGEAIQTEAVKGPIVKQAELCFSLLQAWLMRDYRLHGALLKGKTLVPEIALREAIANAIIHRKYWVTGAIKIALYEDRLEIFSPGNFPGLVDTKHLGDGTTYLRNPNLARLARKAKLVEKLGTGIRLIRESCDKVGLMQPEFIEGSDSVKVIFRFLPSASKKSSKQDELYRLFEMKEEVALRDVETMLGVSRNTATRKLNRLIDAGTIKRQGKGPAVRYYSC